MRLATTTLGALAGLVAASHTPEPMIFRSPRTPDPMGRVLRKAAQQTRYRTGEAFSRHNGKAAERWPIYRPDADWPNRPADFGPTVSYFMAHPVKVSGPRPKRSYRGARRIDSHLYRRHEKANARAERKAARAA